MQVTARTSPFIDLPHGGVPCFKTGMSRFLTALLAASVLVSPALAEAALTQKYSVLSGGRPVGHVTATIEGQTTSIVYDVKNNGRGPTIAERISFDASGLPVQWTVTGTTTFGSKVDERFQQTGNLARWTDSTGSGEQKVEAPAIYVAQSASPWSLGIYARALMKAGNSMPALPGGTLRLEKIADLKIAGVEGEATAWRLGGIDLSPATLVTDKEGNLLAQLSPRSSTIKAGLEGEDERLRKLAALWASQRLEGLQKELAHKPQGRVRISNARLFDPVTKTLGEPASVVIEGGTIRSIEAANARPAKGETVIDARGGALLPGFFEMHAHIDEEDALLNIAAGITTVRDMGNEPDVLDALQQRIDSGVLAGPRIIPSGFIEGKSPFSSSTGNLVTSEAEAVAAVREAGRKGLFQIKIYNSIDPAWVPAMIREAKAHGLRVAGHVPAFTTADQVMLWGYDELTHANQLMLNWVLGPKDDTRTLLRLTGLKKLAGFDLDSPAPQKTMSIMIERGIEHDPTMVILEALTLNRTGQVPPGAQSWFDHMPIGTRRGLMQAMSNVETPADDAAYRGAWDTTREVMRRLNEKGVLLLPGTDMGGSFWYHRELQLFGDIGMSPADVLRRASYDMANYLKRGDRYGRIAPGMAADLLLVEGDPTRDLKLLHNISLVTKDGSIYFPPEIHERLGIRPFTKAPEMKTAD